MNFNKLEEIMLKRGVSSLAEIARTLKTTPQAVSNWKARNQVPFHIVSRIQQSENVKSYPSFEQQRVFDPDSISFSDIVLILSKQLKVIFLTLFISLFIGFTYIQFIQKPEYISSAKILLPSSNANVGGLAGLASQFGVSVPTATQTDLSSPSLFPELMKSRTLAEKILEKNFFSQSFNKDLSLLAILTYGDAKPTVGEDTLITKGTAALWSMVTFEMGTSNKFSIIKATTGDPLFSRDLVIVVVSELEKLNRFFKRQSINEKSLFIEKRISSVKADLESSERALKLFREENRQINSPALQLEQDRLSREVEVQKSIFLTLKQQFELVKIEEVQKTSIIQMLDKPQIPLGPNNKNLKRGIILSSLIGIGLGIFLGFIRYYFVDVGDREDRRKYRKGKNFLKQKTKDIIFDNRISGIVSIVLIGGLPIYLGYESPNPIYFGKYSRKIMIINTAYIIILIISLIIFIRNFFTKKNH